MPLTLRQKPERIVCLTEEPTEILYLLGEEARIVGISAYTVRPPEAKRDKPVVSAFVSGSVQKIVDLKPDLVIGFSDIQGQLAKDLIEANLQVLIFNQRSLQEILDVIQVVGRLIGQEGKAQDLVQTYIAQIEKVKKESQSKHRPKVYFEEWDDPMISGIRWVSELIEIAGGEDVFSSKAQGKLAKERYVKTEEIQSAKPEIYIASWCGKPFDEQSFYNREGWQDIPAVKNKRVYEMDPSIILQPGPACLTDGLGKLQEIIQG